MPESPHLALSAIFLLLGSKAWGNQSTYGRNDLCGFSFKSFSILLLGPIPVGPWQCVISWQWVCMPEQSYLFHGSWETKEKGARAPISPSRFCPTVPQVRGHLMSFRGRLRFKNVKYQFSLFILFTVPVSPFSSSFQYSQLIFAVLGIDPWPFNMVGKHFTIDHYSRPSVYFLFQNRV